MALFNCSECGREISDKALMCPHCGAPVEVYNNAVNNDYTFNNGYEENVTNANGQYNEQYNEQYNDNNTVYNEPLSAKERFNSFVTSKKGVYIIAAILGTVCIIAVVIVIIINSASKSSSSSSTDSSKSSSTYSSSSNSSSMELFVESALYSEVSKKYSSYDVDPSSCKYRINKQEKGSGNTTVVYGTLTLYDKYGNLVSSKKTDPFKDFEVTIDNSTYKVKSTKIN